MKNILFAGSDFKFVNHIIDYFEKDLKYNVKKDQWKGPKIHEEKKSEELLHWADVIFCEWGLGNVIWYQQHKKADQKLIVRVHRVEMTTEYPRMFDYNKIDQIIAISPYIFEEFHRVAKIPREKMIVIYNAIDIDRFDIEKIKSSTNNIAIIGISPKLKRLDRALDIFENLYENDNKYKLFIKGKRPEEYSWIWNNDVERNYYERQFDRIRTSKWGKSVVFEEFGDTSEFLTKIGYVLSVSDYESFHMAPVEGMTSGAYPLVLQREGVNTVFPCEFIFEKNNEIVDFILNDKEEFNLKGFVQKNYDLKKICKEIEKCIVS